MRMSGHRSRPKQRRRRWKRLPSDEDPSMNRPGMLPLFSTVVALGVAGGSFADAVIDANSRAAEIASSIKQTPVAVRAMALVQVSVFDAVQSIAGRHRPMIARVPSAPGASLEAAAIAATRTAL